MAHKPTVVRYPMAIMEMVGEKLELEPTVTLLEREMRNASFL
jgi:arginine-tRNA-protein transferase